MNEQGGRMNELRLARAAGRRIAVIGGGTGLSTLLLGLKEYTDNITAIVTVTDDGGGSGMLRREYGMLPPGDIRNCILSLANTSDIMGQLLNYRFSEGGLAGQNFGNLFLLALNEIFGSFEQAVASMNQILAVTGKVLPVTTKNVALRAVFEDGTTVLGETSICQAKARTGKNILRVELTPPGAVALPQAVEAIMQADAVILGPGSLYTSIIPNLLVDGIADALKKTEAMRLYVLNIMTQPGETEGYSALQHVEEILAHAGGNVIDTCLYNTREMHKRILNKYAQEGSEPIYPYPGDFDRYGIRLIGSDVLSRSGALARHDPLRLAYSIMKALADLAPRPHGPGQMDEFLLHG